MKRAIFIAGLVLVLQLGLAFGLWLKSDNAGAYHGGKLLAITAGEVDGLQIDGGNQGAIDLHKSGGHWHLPGHFDAVVDDHKVDALLSTLLAIERSWPVARTEASFQRFKVADSGFDRRLQFKSGDKVLATLLLGSSPGFRKVHARLAGEKQVYDIPFSSYQASLTPVDWIDKQQLALKPEQIVAVDLPAGHLTRKDGRLQLANLAAGEETDSEHARQLIDRLARLTIQDVDAGADQPLPAPAKLSLRLELKDGTSRRYDFAQGDKEGSALLKVSSVPYLFKIDGTLLSDLQQTTRSTLVKPRAGTDQPTPPPVAKTPARTPRG